MAYPVHQDVKRAAHGGDAERQVRRLLSGSQGMAAVDEAVAAHHKHSRSHLFADKEDIDAAHAEIVRNAKAPVLIEAALASKAGKDAVARGTYLSSTGALAVRSGAKTGRSPKDKRVVDEPSSREHVWWGPVNVPLSQNSFMVNRERAIDYLNTREKLYVIDGYAGWDPAYRIKVRVVCARAYHALFMRNMLVMLEDLGIPEGEPFEPDFTILNAGNFPANRYVEGMTSSCSVDVSFERREMVILGTQYAGEMKKGILTLMMYLMPLRNQLCLHSSANEDKAGNVTLFFGLSGTGKTTLSADPRRSLIGDDEHVWTDTGVFNVEGGCYAKCAALSAEKEPEIFSAIRFGAVLENVEMDPATREVDFDDLTITENTRCAYPLSFIPNAKLPAVGGHPNHVVLLTCDGFGVLPPISRLSREQVVYHFVSGYTSKMAGTEQGITKPVAAFSACYGEPFLVWHPLKYADMLAERLERHQASCWLLNTGWLGGAARGQRCPLKYSRAIVDAIHEGQLDEAEFQTEDIFGLSFPTRCPNVPAELLDPAGSWADKADFRAVSLELARLFRENFAKYEAKCSADVLARGGPLC